MKPRPDHIAKVQDAIVVLKSKGAAHYRPDIARYTGLSQRSVGLVLDHLEAKAKNAPKGRVTIPWTEMKGDKGGIAISNRERMIARGQRRRSILAQASRHEERVGAEYRRTPIDDRLAKEWARSARSVSKDRFLEARTVVDEKHLQALVDSGMDVLPAYKDHLILMAEIDAL